MSLDDMLASHDETALAALTSPGALRRAIRAAADGDITVLSRAPDCARVELAGLEVTLSALGPANSACPCPATGICHHILTAIIALRATPQEQSPSSGPSVLEELLALTDDALRSFAGSDLLPAAALAAGEGTPTVSESGRSLVLRLPQATHDVTFISGAGLKGAVFKGPASRKRQMVTAAVLSLRALHNRPFDLQEVESGPSSAVDTEFLSLVAARLPRATMSTLTGNGRQAHEQLFDLAISARAGAVPRLSRALRRHAGDSALAAQHHVAFDEERFVADMGRSLALTHALIANPRNAALAGQIRRDYAEHPPAEVFIAGARVWTTASGARGLRVHALDLANRRWFSGGPARGPGMDPGFHPVQAYRLPLWSSQSPERMIGKTLRLSHLLAAEDGTLSGNCRAEILDDQPVPDVARLEEAGLLHRSWHALRDDLSRRLPPGLSAFERAVPILIAAARLFPPRFDDLAQKFHIDALDGDGTPLSLTLPGSMEEEASTLHARAASGGVLLCEATLSREALLLTPVGILSFARQQATVENLWIDNTVLPRQGLADRIRKATSRLRGVSSAVPPGPIQTLADRCLQAAAHALTYGRLDDAAELAARAEALGLLHLSDALARSDDRPESHLRLAYLASELSRQTLLRHGPGA